MTICILAGRGRHMYDFMFRNVIIIDGTKTARYRGDVAVQGEHVAAVGVDLPGPARRTVQGQKRVLAPGFIDIHTHSDFPLFIDPRGESKIRQGVTTEVIGNCGGWAAPLQGEARQTAARQLETFGFTAEIPWRDLSGYLDTLAAGGHR